MFFQARYYAARYFAARFFRGAAAVVVVPPVDDTGSPAHGDYTGNDFYGRRRLLERRRKLDEQRRAKEREEARQKAEQLADDLRKAEQKQPKPAEVKKLVARSQGLELLVSQQEIEAARRAAEITQAIAAQRYAEAVWAAEQLELELQDEEDAIFLLLSA